MGTKLMNRKEVCEALSVSSARLHRGMADGRFPKPYRVGDNSVRWKSNEIQDFIDQLEVSVPIDFLAGTTAKRGRQKKT